MSAAKKNAEALEALGALANEHRLALFRLLVARGPQGLAAGDLAERLDLAPSSLTFHIQALMRAGLIAQQRNGRQLIYSADFAAMNDLIGFLTENCCGESEKECGAACAPAREPAPKRKRA